MIDDGEVVGFFIGGWYMFDNFAPFQVDHKGVLYPTLEHAYQSLKYIQTNPDLAETIRLLGSPVEVYEFTRNMSVSTHIEMDWDSKKINIMEELCREKLQQHPTIQRELLVTGSRTMVEMNDIDSFWGWGADRNGRNELGKIWMRLRKELTHA